MGADNPEHRGQAEPAPDEFRREEWIKDPGLDLRVHAAAGVGHLDIHKAARSGRHDRAVAAQIRFIALHDTGRDVDGAVAFRDRLRGIDDEIHDHLPQLRRVGFNQGDGFVEMAAELDLLRDRDLDQMRHLSNQAGETERFRDEPAFAGVGKHLPAQLGGAT